MRLALIALAVFKLQRALAPDGLVESSGAPIAHAVLSVCDPLGVVETQSTMSGGTLMASALLLPTDALIPYIQVMWCIFQLGIMLGTVWYLTNDCAPGCGRTPQALGMLGGFLAFLITALLMKIWWGIQSIIGWLRPARPTSQRRWILDFCP
jgi:hypothetical protein